MIASDKTTSRGLTSLVVKVIVALQVQETSSPQRVSLSCEYQHLHGVQAAIALVAAQGKEFGKDVFESQCFKAAIHFVLASSLLPLRRSSGLAPYEQYRKHGLDVLTEVVLKIIQEKRLRAELSL